jgi:anthranilate phosphoribosyltransferase
MKGESIDEITAAASVMRELATKVEVSPEHLIDTCGTGGDRCGAFNISTASAIVSAAAGAKVAKHGNRSISSKCGSADVLELAGVNLDITPQQVAECINTVGVGFMFAPKHHSSMKYAVGPRKEMGVRTIFNVLGPLTNPASAPNQVLGVFSKDLVEPMAQVLKNLGSQHVMVVHSRDGMDEISISANTFVAELKNGEVKCYEISPEDFEMPMKSVGEIRVDSAEQSLAMIRTVFENQPGAARDIVLLNAGAAIYVAGIAASQQQGIDLAADALASGAAQKTFDALIETTRAMSS